MTAFLHILMISLVLLLPIALIALLVWYFVRWRASSLRRAAYALGDMSARVEEKRRPPVVQGVGALRHGFEDG